MGDVFFEWFGRQRWSGTFVQRVPRPPSGSVLDVIPATLAGFDLDDHEWIGIYLLGGADYIVNAVDSDWAEAESDLLAAGINVLELLA